MHEELKTVIKLNKTSFRLPIAGLAPSPDLIVSCYTVVFSVLVFNRPLSCKNILAYNLPKNLVSISSIKLSVDRCDIIELAHSLTCKMQIDKQMAYN